METEYSTYNSHHKILERHATMNKAEYKSLKKGIIAYGGLIK